MSEKRDLKELYYVQKGNFKFLRAEVTLTLDRPKDGCNKIFFDMRKPNPIHDMLIHILQQGKSFDFTIGRKLGNGLCTIDELEFEFRS